MHGQVYDVSHFDHPGGEVLQIAYGREATALYESHHALVRCDATQARFDALLAKFRIGTVRSPPKQPNFDAPFATALKKRCREAMKANGRVTQQAPTWKSFLPVPVRPLALLWISYKLALSSGWMLWFWAIQWGVLAAAMQGLMHAGSHHALSTNYYVNLFGRCVGEVWGLREANWVFAHVVSHHMECYTQKDYMVDQHVPPFFFRIYKSTPWVPRYAWQHVWYVLSWPLAVANGCVRWNCAPFCFALPLKLAYNKLLGGQSDDSGAHVMKTLPGPRNMPDGSSHPESAFEDDDTLTGPTRFMVFSSLLYDLRALVLGNVVTLPMFLALCSHEPVWKAVAVLMFAFGCQSAMIVESTLTQHLVEDVVVHPDAMFKDDWFAHQVASSADVLDPVKDVLGDYIGWQVVHHCFPPLWGSHARLLRPIVADTAKEFGVPYLLFDFPGAMDSVYRFLWKHSTPECSKPPPTPKYVGVLMRVFKVGFVWQVSTVCVGLYSLAQAAGAL